MGVMSGDDRGAVDIAGETAGSIVGERMIVALCGDVVLRAETETSEGERLCSLGVGFGALMSMCVGAVPRWRRCCDGS